LHHIRADNRIEIIYPDSVLQQEGWEVLRRFGGTGANAVDCTSFAIMHARRIQRAYTFDARFHQAGFRTLVPGR
jgi:predicted nucleic acid-binding protein